MQRSLRTFTVLTATTALAALGLVGAPAAFAAGDPVSMTNGFYVDPDNSAAQWVAANPGDGRASAIEAAIADEPAADWFGDWSGDIGEATGAYVGAAANADELPVLVAYDIPDLDICAGQSTGGATSDSAY
jgi:endoglucanase